MTSPKKNTSDKIVLFQLEKPRYAIYLNTVVRVVQSVEITALPKAPKKIMGVINYLGEIIPVIDLRKLFHLKTHPVNINDQFIITQCNDRIVVLVVDAVIGIKEIARDQIIDSGHAFPYAEYLKGITIIENEIVLINDLEKLLSIDEHQLLDKAIKKIENEPKTSRGSSSKIK